MKTLRIMLALCFLLVFTANVANAQAQTWKEEIYKISEQAPCMEETATGVQIIHLIGNKNSYSTHTTMELIGDETGAVYSVKEKFTYKYVINENNGQSVLAFITKGVIDKDGKPIAEIRFIIQFTTNAEGEVTSFKDEQVEWQCL